MLELCICALIGAREYLLVCMCDSDGVPRVECVWEDTMYGSFAAVCGVVECLGVISLDYASVMMCELCMHALVGLDITCVYVMVRGTVCTVYAWEVWVICGIRRCQRVSTWAWACLWFYIDA
jgi:hypothetical protein